MKAFVVTLFAAFILAPCLLHAQQGKGREKAEQLEKLKMIEALNLDEETAIKLIVRTKDFRRKIMAITEASDSVLGEMDKALTDKATRQYKKLADDFIKNEALKLKARADYYASAAEILSEEQMLRLMIFEKEFRKELQDLMFKNRRRFRGGEGDN